LIFRGQNCFGGDIEKFSVQSYQQAFMIAADKCRTPGIGVIYALDTHIVTVKV
jgi:hypothetical protein